MRTDQGESPIRVVTADLDGAISAGLHLSIEKQPDMRLIEHVASELDVLKAGEKADVVILGVKNSSRMPGICTHLINEYPHLKIVVVADKEKLAVCYWLDLQERQIESYTEDIIISTVRWLHEFTPG